jgi:hypothetical protein
MNSADFPCCCTAKVIIGFGESRVAAGGAKLFSFEEIEAYINRQIEVYSGPLMGYAALVAITNNEQKTANKVLRHLGFNHSTWMAKETHENTKIRLWWYALNKQGDDNGKR